MHAPDTTTIDHGQGCLEAKNKPIHIVTPHLLLSCLLKITLKNQKKSKRHVKFASRAALNTYIHHSKSVDPNNAIMKTF